MCVYNMYVCEYWCSFAMASVVVREQLLGFICLLSQGSRVPIHVSLAYMTSFLTC